MKFTSTTIEKTAPGTLKTAYWGSYFVEHFGIIRDKLYKKRFGYVYPFPEHLGVPVEGGIYTHDNGRVVVIVVDNQNIQKLEIKDAIKRVKIILTSGYR